MGDTEGNGSNCWVRIKYGQCGTDFRQVPGNHLSPPCTGAYYFYPYTDSEMLSWGICLCSLNPTGRHRPEGGCGLHIRLRFPSKNVSPSKRYCTSSPIGQWSSTNTDLISFRFLPATSSQQLWPLDTISPVHPWSWWISQWCYKQMERLDNLEVIMTLSPFPSQRRKKEETLCHLCVMWARVHVSVLSLLITLPIITIFLLMDWTF